MNNVLELLILMFILWGQIFLNLVVAFHIWNEDYVATLSSDFHWQQSQVDTKGNHEFIEMVDGRITLGT